jgi:glucoamylase
VRRVGRRGPGLALALTLAAAVLGQAPAAAQGGGAAPGGPGADAGYTPADKVGFGTARSSASPVWFTLGGGRMTEVYYPDLSTPASRDTQLVVTDGAGFVQREQDVPVRTELVDPATPSYRQIATGTGWTATTTYVTDPDRATVLMDVQVRSTTGRPLRAYLLHDPSLSGEGNDDRAWSTGGALVAGDAKAASALVADRGFDATSVGYLGVNDGWTDLSAHHGQLAQRYTTAGPGNVVQVGQLRVDGVGADHATVALGFGAAPGEAMRAAAGSLARGFGPAAGAYAAGWHGYLDGLPRPASLADAHQRDLYTSSLVVLAASEDKRHPGAFVASPTMPWAFGTDRAIAATTGSYHLVWPRDLYQMASALLAAGDRGAAGRALDYLLSVQQPDGHWSQNTTVAGEPYWTSVQLDETAAPMLLAGLLDRHDPATLDHLKRGAEFLVNYAKDGHAAPYSEQERWENQSGYSPATIASAVAGLVTLADLCKRSGDTASADRYLAVADRWRAQVDSWTVTHTGPYSPQPYYLRLTKDGQPDAGTRYALGDNNPGTVDQRAVVDPSFLELVRLGLKRADDPVVRNTVAVVDRQLAVDTPTGRHWYRFTSDGYGEQPDGGPWDVNRPDIPRTYGRLWPIFDGERGEYELLAGDPALARQRLGTMAATASSTLLLPEQVWDNRPPVGSGGPTPGTPTTSATPLAWTHAQFVRLAWSLAAGHPVEEPAPVACRYLGC